MDETILTGSAAPADLIPVLDAMDMVSLLQITAGKAKPISVWRNGSTRALNDFQTCSTLRFYGNLDGDAVERRRRVSRPG